MSPRAGPAGRPSPWSKRAGGGPRSRAATIPPKRAMSRAGPGDAGAELRRLAVPRALGRQAQGRRVDAVAQARRPRAVREDVTEVPAARGAQHLGPGHEQRAVLVGVNGIGGDRLGETRPAGARLEFRLRAEELGATARAAVDARSVLIPVLPGKGALRALLAKDVVLLRGQSRAPVGVALGDLRGHGHKRTQARELCTEPGCRGHGPSGETEAEASPRTYGR